MNKGWLGKRRKTLSLDRKRMFVVALTLWWGEEGITAWQTARKNEFKYTSWECSHNGRRMGTGYYF
jgi:hypothetical protein